MVDAFEVLVPSSGDSVVIAGAVGAFVWIQTVHDWETGDVVFPERR